MKLTRNEELELDGLLTGIESMQPPDGDCAGEVRGKISASRSRAVWERNMVRVWNRAIQDAANIVRGEPGVDEDRECEEVAAQIEALLRDFDAPKVESWYQRRDELGEIKPRTEAEEAELEDLREKIWSLPTAQTPEAQKSMDVVHRAAELLRKHDLLGE